jgi:hypothetical protein
MYQKLLSVKVIFLFSEQKKTHFWIMYWMKFKIFLADRMMQFSGRGCEINMYISNYAFNNFRTSYDMY